MLKTLLHKTLLITLLIFLGGWAGVAQVYAVKGDSKRFFVDENANYLFHWSVYNKGTGQTKYLASKTHETEDVVFDTPGVFEVRVYPEDKGTHCFGDQQVIEVHVTDEVPTAVFADTNFPAVCAASNVNGERENVTLEVEYTGPKPWTFKYSMDSSPAQQPEGAEEIWGDSFEFSLSIPNSTGKTKTVEIVMVEAESLSGIAVEENPDKQRVEIKVLRRPVPEFEEYAAVKLVNSSETYVGVINKRSGYTAIISAGGTITRSDTEPSEDGKVEIDVQWGSTPGDQRLMLVEQNMMGCYSDTLYAHVKLVDSYTVSIAGEIAFCEGGSSELTASVDLPGNYSYSWSNGANSETIEVSEADRYTVTVEDLDNSGTQTASVDVTVWPAPHVDLGADYFLADGDSKILDAGNEGSSYEWTTGETTQSIIANALGIYRVSVTNAQGCSASDEILLYNLFTIELGEDQNICAGQEVTLDPNPKFKVSQNYTFAWDNGSSAPTITVDEAGDYQVTVTDEAGNELTDQVHVEVHPLPIVDLGEDVVLYDGETKVLDAGDAGVGATYSWSTGESTQTITVSEAGLYSCKVIGVFGCSNIDDVTVVRKEGHQFSVDLGGDKEICEGDRIYLVPVVDRPVGADPRYSWSNGSTESGIFAEEAGEYCVEITDEFENTESDCMTLTVNPRPTVYLGPDVVAQSGKSVKLIAETDATTYFWSTDEVSQEIEVTRSDEYWVEVMSNPYNCIGRDTVMVAFEEELDLLPGGFSPNGDDLNDKFGIKVEYKDKIKKISLIIYNRIGNKIFQSNSIDVKWDGTYRGQKQDMDVYVYLLRVTFNDKSYGGKTIVKEGNVTLLY